MWSVGTLPATQRAATRTASASLLSALLVLVFILPSTVLAQSLYSPYPSRTTILAQADRSRENASLVDHVRQHTGGRVVLGYVTPWNPRGTELAERFRGKFDIIAPAWHNVDLVHTSGKTFYVVNGGPTGKHDDEWVRRMQAPSKDGNGNVLPPVKITPRFVLDRFSPEDLVELLQSDALMLALAEKIAEEVIERAYDGAVFECAAVWAIEPLVQMLTERLRGYGKTLSVVVPSVRSETDPATQQTNKIGIHAMRVLSRYVDHVMVMTYDHAASVGRAYADVHTVDDLPQGSPLAQDGVRTPGPNSPLDFLTLNIETMSGNLEVDGTDPGQFGVPGYDASSPFYSSGGNNGKLLLGVALYGYRYPIGWFDKTLNNSDGLPRIPPKTPMVAQDNDTAVQARYRAEAEARESNTPTVLPVLRFPGEPFKHSDLVAQLRDSKALIRLDEDSQEQFVDYVAPLPAAHQPKIEDKGGDEKDMTVEQLAARRPLASYYRAYFPSAHTIRKRLETIGQFPDVGIALWDVGQAGEWLLHEL